MAGHVWRWRDKWTVGEGRTERREDEGWWQESARRGEARAVGVLYFIGNEWRKEMLVD